MFSRIIDPMAIAETPGISSRVVSFDAIPTVTATATVTWSRIITRPFALPLVRTLTGFRFAASSAVTPARYWPGFVPRGTVTVNCTLSPVPGSRVTVGDRSVIQQPTPEQRPNAWRKAVPPFPAVTPVDRLMISFSVVFDGLLSSALVVTECPGATFSVKYGADRPYGDRPNGTLGRPSAIAGRADDRTVSAARAAAARPRRHRRPRPLTGRTQSGSSRARCTRPRRPG